MIQNLAIVGAAGLVGTTMLTVLQERKIQIKNLQLFGTERSAGKTLKFNGADIKISAISPKSFDSEVEEVKKAKETEKTKKTEETAKNNTKIALFSAGAAASKEYAPIAAKNGYTVIDNSSAWRMDETVPLVVPEVNPADAHKHNGIIANPNCSTIQAVVVLNSLHKRYNIKRVVYTTFQAVSGAGSAGIADLQRTANGEPPQHFPQPIAGNCIPQIDVFDENGYSGEELKMINETRKILHAPQLKITATTVRVPVLTGHSESVNITLEKPFELAEVHKILAATPGVVVQDISETPENPYPTPLAAAGTDAVYVGRIRRDFSAENSLNLWIVADNIRKGAATNAVQILQLLVTNNA